MGYFMFNCAVYSYVPYVLRLLYEMVIFKQFLVEYSQTLLE